MTGVGRFSRERTESTAPQSRNANPRFQIPEATARTSPRKENLRAPQ
jgi:hypothetical protein